ncbi:MAG: replication-associated recombination protein A [candidate division KSB1 bacterium]|nr:replication-associated recombination protein A [candidate division KSB1 bacterium]MDZ7275749.1 replication-associated recombination protein A [candidate division KSB1 bacterium]MDZ7284560.1 replication-associated recombination protein A [candidate division KSB1 bacterium]MDZ7298021.1 replication-associated recombination protein A [candidate division KSB1 bacterium]MDZ7307736.1 replication-associated recombination protein A [candidate division KSB1 bacterium]
MDLFNQLAQENLQHSTPLAERMRPRQIDDFVGQEHLLGPGKALRLAWETGTFGSLLLWGPPGSGKTTLAKLLAQAAKADFFMLSAVASGVAEVREVLQKATNNRRSGRRTILFIDEIHRFNKAQQDALLQRVEDGTITLIGATTENPSFEVIAPLLSRCQVYTLKPLEDSALRQIIARALAHDRQLQQANLVLEAAARDLLVALAAGDGRTALNGLEQAVRLCRPNAQGQRVLTVAHIREAVQKRAPLYDRAGDQHYDTISAFIKSVRGGDPNAALHYLARMLEAGEDPKFIARRLIILASEDIGNAEPLALVLATSAFTAVTYVGMPEAGLVLAQATTFLASAPKSNASYRALSAAIQDVREKPLAPIPLHLRNAPTDLLAQAGHGRGYQYPHDFPGHFVEQEYLPENLTAALYYRPSASGMEADIARRLQAWWEKYREQYNGDQAAAPPDAT